MHKFTNNTFGAITEHFIKTTAAANNTRVSEQLMLYETRQNPKKAFKVFSCVIYTIISNYFLIDYLACE